MAGKQFNQWMFTTEQEEAIRERYGAIAEVGYNEGVRDARAHTKDPSVDVWLKGKDRFFDYPYALADRTSPAEAPPAEAQPVEKTPYELAARAREIQDEAAKNGKPISNEDSVRMAYVENNIAWK
jgi:hypothetical protein